jgi:hypothetical protein
MARLMRGAGFVDVATTVRHFQVSDTLFTRLLAPHIKRLGDPRVLDRLGRIGGWYVIARGSVL